MKEEQQPRILDVAIAGVSGSVAGVAETIMIEGSRVGIESYTPNPRGQTVESIAFKPISPNKNIF